MLPVHCSTQFGGTTKRVLFVACLSVAGFVGAVGTGTPARALIITPNFDSSITSNANAAAIEGAINTAISTIDGLYSNSVDLPVTFTYTPLGTGVLSNNTQLFYDVPYARYVSLLQIDLANNPENTVLATAIANLSKGNDATGSNDMGIGGGQLTMLREMAGLPSITPGNATININTMPNFSFTGSVSSTQFDGIGAIEHELNEVLGGGGAGSRVKAHGSAACTAPMRQVGVRTRKCVLRAPDVNGSGTPLRARVQNLSDCG